MADLHTYCEQEGEEQTVPIVQDVLLSFSIELLARGWHVVPQVRQLVRRHGQVIPEGAHQDQGQAA